MQTTTITPMDRHEARAFMEQTLMVHSLPSVRDRTGGVSRFTGHSEGQVLSTFHAAMNSALDDARTAALADADELLTAAQSGTMSASEAQHDAHEALRFAAYVETLTR